VCEPENFARRSLLARKKIAPRKEAHRPRTNEQIREEMRPGSALHAREKNKKSKSTERGLEAMDPGVDKKKSKQLLLLDKSRTVLSGRNTNPKRSWLQ
jgi:hypothetical protein